MENLPSVGRIVHYVSRGSADGKFSSEHTAAIITAVNNNSFTVSLSVFYPTGLNFVKEVMQDEGCAPGTYHWPERV